jgi:hypothetical protein
MAIAEPSQSFWTVPRTTARVDVIRTNKFVPTDMYNDQENTD